MICLCFRGRVVVVELFLGESCRHAADVSAHAAARSRRINTFLHLVNTALHPLTHFPVSYLHTQVRNTHTHTHTHTHTLTLTLTLTLTRTENLASRNYSTVEKQEDEGVFIRVMGLHVWRFWTHSQICL